MAYFDWNATAPLVPEAKQAWLDASDLYWANPSSSHRLGVQSRLALEEAREDMASRLSVEPDQLIFTSGATEATSGFISGVYRQSPPESEIWISSVEHPSVHESALSFWGMDRINRIPVSKKGELDLSWIEDHLKHTTPKLISVMAANNETGVLHPWEKVLGICRTHGIAFHCDAVQWIGKMPATAWEGCDGVSVSAHKFGGPKGTGCLILGKDWRGLKLQAGGPQERESRAGTENIPGVLGMVAAFRLRDSGPVPDSESRDWFETALSQTWPGEVLINGQGTGRLWNTSSVSLPGYRSERWIALLDRGGFQVSSGSACATGTKGPSPVLKSMGSDDERIRRTIRISGGWETRRADWEDLLAAIVQVRGVLDQDAPDGPGKVIKI